MARRIEVKLGEELSAFGFTRVDRAKLYGKKQRVILDEEGNVCTPAYLTYDGAALVPSGGTAMVYVDEHFDTIDRKELHAVDAEGQPLDKVPSTLGVAQELTEVDAPRLLDHVIRSVYELEPEDLGEELKKKLEEGALFEMPFNYRDGYDADAAFLLSNDEGYFALIGQPTGFELVVREATASEEDDEGEDELDDDFDFAMM